METLSVTGVPTEPSVLARAAAAPRTGAAGPDAARFGQVLTEQVGVTTIGAPEDGTGCRCDMGDGAALLGPDGVPSAYAAFGNGRVPTDLLQPIPGAPGQALWPPAARAFGALRDAAARVGVDLEVAGSYRAPRSLDDARPVALAPDHPAAARGTALPDFGWGMGLDLRLDDRASAWMRAHGPQYGFVAGASGQPWHWTYRPTH